MVASFFTRTPNAGNRVVTESPRDNNSFLRRWRQRIERAPWFDLAIEWGEFVTKVRKIVSPSAWIGVGFVAFLVAIYGFLSSPGTQLPTPPKEVAVVPKPEPPQIFAPVMIEERKKRDCVSVTMAKMRPIALADDPSALRRYRSLRLCDGWWMTLKKKDSSRGTWVVKLESRDVNVEAELADRLPAVREGEVVQIGGTIVKTMILDDEPWVFLKNAWLKRQ